MKVSFSATTATGRVPLTYRNVLVIDVLQSGKLELTFKDRGVVGFNKDRWHNLRILEDDADTTD